VAEIRTLQPSFAGGELGPALHGRVDIAKYQVGLKTGKNVIVSKYGGVMNRAGLQFVCEVKNSASPARLIPFSFNTEQTYVLELGNAYMRFIRDGGQILSGGSPYEIVTPYAVADVERVNYAQEADVMFLAHRGYAPRKLSRASDVSWSLVTPTFAPVMTAPGSVAATATTGSGSVTYNYRVSSISPATGEESLPSAIASTTNDLTTSGNQNTVTWAAVTGAARYVVYKEDNGVYGYIGGTEGLSFVDENITADLADTPQSGRNPFIGTGNYPGVVTFYEQRLTFASTTSDPQVVELSQTANYENFGRSSPTKPNDAISFRVRASQVNQIRAMVPTRGLMLMTSGAEFLVTGSGQEDYLTPENVKRTVQSYWSCSEVQPIVIGSVILFAPARGGTIRDLGYEFAEDTFSGKELNILSPHLFEGREVKAMAYAQAPLATVWCVLDDGSCVSMTYLREQEIWGWTRHETQGEFEDVTVISEGNRDVPYFIIKRTIGGVTKRYIERMASRYVTTAEEGFFVDSGLTYDGSPATVFSGLGHLEGKTVVALADGNVVRDLVVASGAVTLPNAASKVHIGLPYESDIETLAIDLGSIQGIGSVQGRYKTISEVTIRVHRSRGMFIGPNADNLSEWKQRSTETYDAAIDLFTGDFRQTLYGDWNLSGSVFMRQSDPLPMEILAIMPDVTLGR
jgi:hypothetical protein